MAESRLSPWGSCVIHGEGWGRWGCTMSTDKGAKSIARKFFGSLVERTFSLLGVAVFLVPIAVLAYQLWVLANTGVWPSLSVMTLLVTWMPERLEGSWLLNPQSWFGLHKVVIGLLDLPLALAALCASIVVLLAISAVASAIDEIFDR